jgi:hemoglobin-like flavoprotein
MTPAQIAAVKSSFTLVAPNAEQAGAAFYGKLFALDPSLRALFAADLSEQARKLMQVLNFAVENLDRPETLMPAVRDLGQRHVGYGVKEPHYDAVATALLATLAEALGGRFTAEVKQAWVEAYTALATEMKEAARSTAASA